MERRRVVATLALLALVALAGCEEAPNPEIVCAGCDRAPEQTDNVTVNDSVTHFYVDSEGDARVEARMNLSGAGIADLRRNRSKVQDIVQTVEGRTNSKYARSAFDRRNLTGRMDGDTFVVTYRVSDVGQRRLGTTVVDAFFRLDADGREDEDDYDDPYELGTDRLVVHGPNGTRSLVDPADGTSDGDRVTWTGDEISTRTYVVFGTAGALARPAIALETLSWAGLPAILLALVLSVPLLGPASAFVFYYPRRLDDGWSPRDDWLFGAILGLGGLLVAHFIFLSVLGAIGTLLTLALLALAIWRYRPDRRVGKCVRQSVESAAGAVWPPEITDERLTAVAVATVFTALIAVVAADYRATVALPVIILAAVVILASFPVLALLVTRPRLSVARAALVTGLAGTVWLFALATFVESGLVGSGFLSFLLVISCIALCPPLFYATLWLATR